MVAGQGAADPVDRKWFNDSMERVGGWYKRTSQWSMVAIALVLAVGLNASTFRIVERFEAEPTVRAAVDKQAEAAVGNEEFKKEVEQEEAEKSGEPEKAAKATEQIESAGHRASTALGNIGELKLPLFWAGENVPKGWEQIGVAVVGWLLTTIAISLWGAVLVRRAGQTLQPAGWPARNPKKARRRRADRGAALLATARPRLARVAPMKIWVDCTAAAHPLVLRPIIERLEERGDEVFITAREYGQTVGILDRLGMHYTVVGEHGGASRLGKARALGVALAGADQGGLGRRAPELALAHGSVDLAVVSWFLRIPSVQMQDYEFANLQRQIAFRAARAGPGAGGDPGRPAAQDRRQAEEAGPLPRPEGGVLPRRLRPRRGDHRRPRARPRAR